MRELGLKAEFPGEDERVGGEGEPNAAAAHSSGFGQQEAVAGARTDHLNVLVTAFGD